jgi:hypothetical protein
MQMDVLLYSYCIALRVCGGGVGRANLRGSACMIDAWRYGIIRNRDHDVRDTLTRKKDVDLSSHRERVRVQIDAGITGH